MEREAFLAKMVPKNTKKVLDIGCRSNIYKDYNTTTVDVGEGADIIQDLNKKQKLPFKSNSFDFVVLNQILEHIGDFDELIKESVRVSKKYLLIGFPNEITYGQRIKILFGKPAYSGYLKYGHKHYFTINKIEEVINHFFKSYKYKYYWFLCTGTKFIPRQIQKILLKFSKSLFAGQVYYILDKEDFNKIRKNN